MKENRNIPPPQSCSPHLSKKGGEDFGTATPHESAIDMPGTEAQFIKTEGKKGGHVVYINSDTVGGQDNAHSCGLMHNFLYALTEIAPQPKAIILVNSAVRLARPGSAALESLSLMHEQGVKILVCERSTREIEEARNIAVGKAVTMHAILDTLLNADKIISP